MKQIKKKCALSSQQSEAIQKQRPCPNPSVNPDATPCPKFDTFSIAEFPVGDEEKIGVPVIDNCAEEHIQ